MPPLLLYIHGFLSSPLSEKAVAVGDYLKAGQLAIDYQVPQLSNYPGRALAQLQQLIAREQSQRPAIALIGSSMGGFYATVLAQQYDLRAVLVNPAVRPAGLIADYLGAHANPYTGEQFCLTADDVDQLRAMEPQTLSHPERLWLMLQTGDETLDYRDAVEYYQQSPQLVEPGGNHRFVDFERHLPAVLKFLGLG